MPILFAFFYFFIFLGKAPVGSLSLVAHGRHFTLQLSIGAANLLRVELAVLRTCLWLSSSLALCCGFGSFWISQCSGRDGAVPTLLLLLLYPFPWFLDILWVFTSSVVFLNAHWKTPVLFLWFTLHWVWKEDCLYISCSPSFSPCHLFYLVCPDFSALVNFPTIFHHTTDIRWGLGATRNFPAETWIPLRNLPVWITVHKARPEGARLLSKGSAVCAGFDSLPCVIICVFAKGMEKGPW